MSALCEIMAAVVSRRFVESNATMASGVGARLSLFAVLALDLAVPAPSPYPNFELRSLAPLVRPGAGLQFGAAALQETLPSVVQGAGASRPLYESFSLQSVLPFAASGAFDAVASYLPVRHSGRVGLAAFLPSSSLDEIDFFQVSLPSPVLGDVALSARLHMFAGLAAGVGIASLSGYVFTEHPDDNGNNNPAVPPPGDGSGVGGGRRNDDDHERYLLLLKLLLELCQGGDGEEALSNFQRLKQLLQREWYELHKKKEELNLDKIRVDVDKEKNRVERETVDIDLERVSKALSDIGMREQKMKEELGQMEADGLKLKADRADLDEKLRVAGLDREKLEDLLYRASLDEKTVREMWKDLDAEQERRRAAGTDKEEGSKGGEEDGGPEEDKRGFLSLVWSVLDTPKRLHAAYSWLSDSYWTIVVILGAVSSIKVLYEAGPKELQEKLVNKYEADKKKVDVILDEFGLPKAK